MNSKAFIAASCGFLTLLAAPASANAEPLPRILSDADTARANPLPDFSYAGYEFGEGAIPHFDNTISVEDYGAIANDDKDDSKAIQAALAAANETDGAVRLQFGSGRYILSEIIWIERSDIVLSGQGMGQGGTEIYLPRPLNQMDDGGALSELREYLEANDKYARDDALNLDVLFSEYSWTAGFIWTRTPDGRHAGYLKKYDQPIVNLADIVSGEQFTRELRVADTGALKPGDVVKIHWHNRQGPEGALIRSIYGEGDFRVGSRHWEAPDRPVVQQVTRIVSINGDRVVIADPLLHDISGALPANFARWDHLSNVGVEDMALTFPPNPYFGHHNEAGFNAIYLTGLHNGWVRNVRISDADAGILTEDIANVTIQNIVTSGEHKAHYSVHLGNVHNVLVDRLTVFNEVEHTFSVNTRSTRSVFKNSEAWFAPTLDQHAGSNHQNLFDNLRVHIRPDEVSEDGSPQYNLFKSGGAGYWQPGHGLYNTIWNVEVIVEGASEPGTPVTILGAKQGPGARIVGMHGNRDIRLEYSPAPYVEALNQRLRAVPSLYDFQLSKRMAGE